MAKTKELEAELQELREALVGSLGMIRQLMIVISTLQDDPEDEAVIERLEMTIANYEKLAAKHEH